MPGGVTGQHVYYSLSIHIVIKEIRRNYSGSRS